MEVEVFLVQYGFDYEGRAVVSAWSDYRSARAACKRFIRGETYCDSVSVQHIKPGGPNRLVFQAMRDRYRGKLKTLPRYSLTRPFEVNT